SGLLGMHVEVKRSERLTRKLERARGPREAARLRAARARVDERFDPEKVLGAYGDSEASYPQLYFDASPDRHPRAYRLLAGLGDDSKTYFWRVLASREVMRLY